MEESIEHSEAPIVLSFNQESLAQKGEDGEGKDKGATKGPERKGRDKDDSIPSGGGGHFKCELYDKWESNN